MADQSLFNQNENTEPQIDPNKDYLTELVGDGKKFKDPKELARGKFESDRYIETLTRTLDEMREDNRKLRENQSDNTKYDELVKLIKEQREAGISPQPGENVKPELKLEDIESAILSKMDLREAQKKEQNNLTVVQERLKERYGNNFQRVLNEQRESLGLSAEDIDALAKKSPTAFFRTLGLDQMQNNSETLFTPPRSSQRSDNFAPTTQNRTWSYYQKMKAENPKKYWDPKTITQRHKDYEALGSAFEDGDFNQGHNRVIYTR